MATSGEGTQLGRCLWLERRGRLAWILLATLGIVALVAAKGFTFLSQAVKVTISFSVCIQAQAVGLPSPGVGSRATIQLCAGSLVAPQYSVRAVALPPRNLEVSRATTGGFPHSEVGRCATAGTCAGSRATTEGMTAGR